MSALQWFGVSVLVAFFAAMTVTFSWVSEEWWVGPLVMAAAVVLTAVLVSAIYLALGWTP